MTINADADINNNVTVALTNPSNALTGSVVVNRGTLSTGTAFGGSVVGSSLTLGSLSHSATFIQTAVGASLTSNMAVLAPLAGTINVTDPGTTVTFNGGLSGVDFTKGGAGTLAVASDSATGSTGILQGTYITPTFAAGAANTTLTIGSTGNSATYQYTGATAAENRALSLAGTGATLTVTQAATTLTLNNSISGSAPLTVSGAGTVVLTTGNLHSGGTTVGSGTTLSATSASGANPLGTGALTMGGGNLILNGNSGAAYFTASGLNAAAFTTPNAIAAGTGATPAGINTYLTSTPVAGSARTLTNVPLSFTSDAAFGSFFNQNNTIGNNTQNFSDVFSGWFTPVVTGAHTFTLVNTDDNADIWIDLNRNGVFEAGEDIVSRHAAGTNTSNGTANLTAGLYYKIAIAHDDTGGGSVLTAQFAEPNVAGATFTTATTINPWAQPGRFQSAATALNDFSNNDLNLTASSSITSSATTLAGIGATATTSLFKQFTPSAGAVLTLTAGNLRFASTSFAQSPSTTFSSAAGTTIALGALNARASPITITNNGSGSLILDDTSISTPLLAGSVLNFNTAGTLSAVTSSTATSLRGMTVNLNVAGSTLALSNTSAASAAFIAPLNVNQNATLGVSAPPVESSLTVVTLPWPLERPSPSPPPVPLPASSPAPSAAPAPPSHYRAHRLSLSAETIPTAATPPSAPARPSPSIAPEPPPPIQPSAPAPSSSTAAPSTTPAAGSSLSAPPTPRPGPATSPSLAPMH